MEDTRYLYDDDIGSVQYIRHYGDDKTIVNSARVSFGADNDLPLNEKDEKLIKYLIKNKHTSTLEHCGVTLKVTVPLFVRSQHHRHRTFSFNEISRRYTDKNLQFYCPSMFRTQHDSNRQASNTDEVNPYTSFMPGEIGASTASEDLLGHVESCLELYENFLEVGICREQARMVLPQNLYTEYYATANLNNIFKFIGLRVDAHAQWEIQRVGEEFLYYCEHLFPVATKAYKELVLSK